MQSDIELVINRFSEIEKRFVDDLNATEKNGHVRTTFIERLNQVEHLFSKDIVILIKNIASLRNKLAHGQLQSIPNRDKFIIDCEFINSAIDSGIDSAIDSAVRNDRFSHSPGNLKNYYTRLIEDHNNSRSTSTTTPDRQKRRYTFVYIFAALFLLFMMMRSFATENSNVNPKNETNLKTGHETEILERYSK